MEWIIALVTFDFGSRLAFTGALCLWVACYPPFKATKWQKTAQVVTAAVAVLGFLICIWSA